MCSLMKARPSICFKTRGRAFETLGLDLEALWDSQKIARESEKLGRFLYYNTAYAVPISHS